jgi:hypothetical protein
MSFPGNNYVVPGANPLAYLVVSDRTSTNTPLTVTATTQATAQTVIGITLSTDYISNISIWSNFTYRSTNGTQHQLFFFLESEVNGVRTTVGFVNTDTIQGNGHFSNCSLVGGTVNTAPNNVILRLKVYASSASVLIVQPAQILAIGNISQD